MLEFNCWPERPKPGNLLLSIKIIDWFLFLVAAKGLTMLCVLVTDWLKGTLNSHCSQTVVMVILKRTPHVVRSSGVFKCGSTYRRVCWGVTKSLLTSTKTGLPVFAIVEIQLYPFVCWGPPEGRAQPDWLRVWTAHWQLHQGWQNRARGDYHQLTQKGSEMCVLSCRCSVDWYVDVLCLLWVMYGAQIFP